MSRHCWLPIVGALVLELTTAAARQG